MSLSGGTDLGDERDAMDVLAGSGRRDACVFLHHLWLVRATDDARPGRQNSYPMRTQ